MEQYLIDDYGVLETIDISTVDDIVDYFTDMGPDYLDCGQGYYQDTDTVIVKIGDKFYDVTFTAEIGSSKQDRGDRLYWVERINKVTFEERPKPEPKVKEEMVTITRKEYNRLLEDSNSLSYFRTIGLIANS